MSFGSNLLLKDKKKKTIVKPDYFQCPIQDGISRTSCCLKTQIFISVPNSTFFFENIFFFCCDSWTHSWAKYNSVHTVKSNFVACLHSKAFPFWFLCKIVLKQEKNLLRIVFSAFWRRNIWIFLSRTLHAYNSKCRWDFQPHWFQTIEERLSSGGR